jgi:8-oxo-dGTP pyrophosphatase MutT (NUDIX family)
MTPSAESKANFIAQAGAIPVMDGRVCLVTSSNGKRWVIPKGIIDPGHTAREAALQEAWEEAGLAGTLRAEPVGTYLYDKWGGTCHVTVFLMDVHEAAADWPERQARQRRWVLPAEALDLVEDPGLREVLRGALRSASPEHGT